MSVAEPQPAVPKPSRRWYCPRLKWVLFALLTIEGFLLFSEQVGWCGLDEDKVVTAALAVAAIIAPILLVLCWNSLVLFWIVARWAFRSSAHPSVVTSPPPYHAGINSHPTAS